MPEYPQNFKELDKLFNSEEACIQYLMRVRWPEGLKCPSCQGTTFWTSGLISTCTNCRQKIHLMAGTIFQDTKLPLRTWFRAIWEVVADKAGVSALSLKSKLKISYKTAWSMLHKLRRAMVRSGRSKLNGRVEVDETVYGGFEPGRRGRGSENKALVAVAVEQKIGNRLGRCRMALLQSASSESLMRFIHENIEEGAEIVTDGWRGYSSVEKSGYRHTIQKLSDGQEALPNAHLVISLLKRWLFGTHQGGMSHEQLEYYLDEFVFRFNRRASKNRTLLFHRLIEGSIEAAPAPFKIIARQEEKAKKAKPKKSEELPD
jgi:transposase-like protein